MAPLHRALRQTATTKPFNTKPRAVSQIYMAIFQGKDDQWQWWCARTTGPGRTVPCLPGPAPKAQQLQLWGRLADPAAPQVASPRFRGLTPPPPEAHIAGWLTPPEEDLERNAYAGRQQHFAEWMRAQRRIEPLAPSPRGRVDLVQRLHMEGGGVDTEHPVQRRHITAAPPQRPPPGFSLGHQREGTGNSHRYGSTDVVGGGEGQNQDRAHTYKPHTYEPHLALGAHAFGVGIAELTPRHAAENRRRARDARGRAVPATAAPPRPATPPIPVPVPHSPPHTLARVVRPADAHQDAAETGSFRLAATDTTFFARHARGAQDLSAPAVPPPPESEPLLYGRSSTDLQLGYWDRGLERLPLATGAVPTDAGGEQRPTPRASAARRKGIGLAPCCD